MAKKKLNFEAAMKRLGDIVSVMEEGSLSLEESLQLYKEGVELSVFCRKSLDEAEKEVMVLRKNADGDFELAAFDE